MSPPRFRCRARFRLHNQRNVFQPLAEAPLAKSKYPVVAIYTSEFEAVVKRVADAGLGYREVSAGGPDLQIIVATDPAGNAVEIIRRAAAAAK